MHWIDDAIILSVRPHGETSAVVEVLAREHGRYMGLVKGGRSRRSRPALQPGNLVCAKWAARLSEHLGNFGIELQRAYASAALEDRAALAAIMTLAYFLRHLPERDPHPSLYEAVLRVLAQFGETGHWPVAYVRCELLLLQELGFGLDLSECAATGATENLIYVSPKSGRAVSANAGEPYKDKLLPLPAFLLSDDAPVSGAGIRDGLTLTGYFLERYLYETAGQTLPPSRHTLIDSLTARLKG